MTEFAHGDGSCLGFGATNARVGHLVDGQLEFSGPAETPSNPAEFADWMARQVLQASHQGDNWVVAGFPGPVNADGTKVGPFANVHGMKDARYNLYADMVAAEPALGRLIEDENYPLIHVNDGELAAQAVAVRVAKPGQDKVAALIVGTGNGSGIVNRDKIFRNVFRPDRSCPIEIGHCILSSDPFDSYEHALAGPGLSRYYNGDTRQFDASHPAARKVGELIAQQSLLLGLMLGAELVVPTGGIGAGASDKYESHMRNVLSSIELHGNETQRLYLPEVALIDPAEAQSFELWGALGVVNDHFTSEVAA